MRTTKAKTELSEKRELAEGGSISMFTYHKVKKKNGRKSREMKEKGITIVATKIHTKKTKISKIHLRRPKRDSLVLR